MADNFDLRKYLAENKITESESTINASYNVIQRKLKELAGRHTVDIKNALDRLGAEDFKAELDSMKPYVDQYFEDKALNEEQIDMFDSITVDKDMSAKDAYVENIDKQDWRYL